jgi:hypothetical protein
LQTELEQVRQALAEADAARSSLSVSWEELERECTCLRTAIDTLRREKAQVVIDREADVAVERKNFRDYHLCHHWKLCEVRVSLESVVNEIGVRCLPYPGKGSTINKIVTWFDNEIKVLLNAIAKANKIFFGLLFRQGS